MWTWATGNLGDLNRNGDPENVAMIDAADRDAPITLTHADVHRRADAVARALVARGFRRGDRIAILAANSADYLCAYFGTMRAGMVSVPVNWRFPTETIRYILEDCEARFVFVDEERKAALPPGIPHVTFGPGFDGWLDRGEFRIVRPEYDEVAMFLYTSGSTGRPKGVPLTHRGHLWVLEARSRFAAKDIARHRFLVAAPMYHMNALAITKFAQYNGASEVILPQFTVERYLGAIERFGCTWLTSVPTMIALIVQQKALLAETDVSTVEVVTMGSAPTTTGLFRSIRESFPGARIAYGYGTTECGPVVFGPHPYGLPIPDLGLGYPVSDVRVRLVAGDDRDAEEGELEMDCPARMPGYHNLPEKTAEVTTPDGYYRTGDVMRRDGNGVYFFVGRVDDMFVTSGENIYPGEVEKMLETNPAIAQACVVPVPDEIRGQKPVAFVVPSAGAQIDEEGVKRYALDNAPPYQHPRRVWFVDVLPLASTNKVDRKLLAERASALLADEQRAAG